MDETSHRRGVREHDWISEALTVRFTQSKRGNIDIVRVCVCDTIWHRAMFKFIESVPHNEFFTEKR